MTLTTLLVQKVFRLPHPTPAWAMTLLINSPGQNLLSILKYPHRVLSLLDSELLVDVNPVKAHPFLGLERNRVNIHVS
jgi:hypothetical protein